MTTADTASALLTGQEVAQQLRISVNTLYRLTDAGEIPGALRIGRLRRYHAGAIKNLIHNNGETK